VRPLWRLFAPPDTLRGFSSSSGFQDCLALAKRSKPAKAAKAANQVGLLKFGNKSTIFFTKNKATFQGRKRKVVNNIFLQPTASLFFCFISFLKNKKFISLLKNR